MDLRFYMSRKANMRWDWPDEVPDAPGDLVTLIDDAMHDFGGPDGEPISPEKLAAIVFQWFRTDGQSSNKKGQTSRS